MGQSKTIPALAVDGVFVGAVAGAFVAGAFATIFSAKTH